MLTLKLDPITHLTPKRFEQLCAANREAVLELTSNGELVIMSPTGGETGSRNNEISFQLLAWNKKVQLGKAFDSSTGFKLPNGAVRSPDASWVSLERWHALTKEEKQTFPPICPDFVVELRSPSDNLKELQDKMQEYKDNGTRLGWLIDPKTQEVEIYRQGQIQETLTNPVKLDGEEVLPGFALDLRGILY